MKRTRCACGRMMNPSAGHDWCTACRRTGNLDEPAPAEPYSETEELDVIRRAREAERGGIVPTFAVCDTYAGIRYLVAGALLDIEGLDHYVARKIRERKANGVGV